VSEHYTVERLADFICNLSFHDIPETTITAAKRCVLDVLGAAAAGVETHSARALRCVMGRQFQKGTASVWYLPRQMNPLAAAVSNSAAASALDVDDGHRDAGGHPGSAVIPAAMAIAEGTGASGRDFLAAVVTGYEIAVRIAAARDFAALDTFSTGRWAAYGAAAAVSQLLSLPASQTAEALAIAGVLSPGLSASGYSALMGNHVKEGIPWATMTGFLAVDLASEGFSGPRDILDHPAYFDARKVVSGLGNAFAIERTYFKMFSCCRWIHSALDALIDLMEKHNLCPERIHRVDIHTFSRALKLNNYAAPPSLESAQYSIPFCLSVAAIKGKEALLPLQADPLTDPHVIAWAHRVFLHKDDALDALFPTRAAARVHVTADDGEYEKTVLDALGDPGNPISDVLLESKFRRLSRRRLSPQSQAELIAHVRTLDQLASLSPLVKLLTSPS